MESVSGGFRHSGNWPLYSMTAGGAVIEEESWTFVELCEQASRGLHAIVAAFALGARMLQQRSVS